MMRVCVYVYNAENVVEHEIGSCVKLRTCTYKNFQYENIKYKNKNAAYTVIVYTNCRVQ